MSPRALVKADLVTALVLIALGLAVAVEAWNMPRFEVRRINPYSVPGIVPGLLGGAIAFMGAILLLRSWRAGGARWELERGEVRAALTDAPAVRLGLALVLCFGYAAGLVGRLPFWLATFLFVLAFIAVFEWRSGETAGQRLIRLSLAALQAILVAAAVSLVFQQLFLVRLP